MKFDKFVIKFNTTLLNFKAVVAKEDIDVVQGFTMALSQTARWK